MEAVEEVLSQQGFGGTLRVQGKTLPLEERVRELLTRYAERGTRIQELALRVESLEKHRPTTLTRTKLDTSESQRLRDALEAKAREADKLAGLVKKLRSEGQTTERELAARRKSHAEATRRVELLEKKLETVTKHQEDRAFAERDPAVVFEAATGRAPRASSPADATALKVAKIGLKHRRRLEDALAALQAELEPNQRPNEDQPRRRFQDLQAKLAEPVELRELCRELELRDVDEVVPAVRKLAAATRALPRFDRFARELKHLYCASDLDDIIAKARETKDALQYVQSALGSKDVRAALDTLQPKLPKQQQQQVLVDEEDSPELSFLVSHILTLFDIRSLDGLLPHLNHLYLRHAELEAFVRDVALLLKAPPHSTIFTLLGLIKDCSRANPHVVEIPPSPPNDDDDDDDNDTLLGACISS